MKTTTKIPSISALIARAIIIGNIDEALDRTRARDKRENLTIQYAAAVELLMQDLALWNVTTRWETLTGTFCERAWDELSDYLNG